MGLRLIPLGPLAFAAVWLGLAPDLARSQAEPRTLRARIAALRASPPPGVPPGSLVSLDYLLDVAERTSRQFGTQSQAWRARAERYLAMAEAGHDPYPAEAGRITNRGYDSPISTIRQGYAIYIPPGYDPSRRYPLLVMLHGGSSNGNLFLGVVLGNNMDWSTYDQHLWDEYTPRWSPDWIVVAPDGFGQVLWRWMGEADVLAVIDDVRHHYSVDDDRIVLGGLSNGGLGAYAIGMRHAWRFSMVTAIAGAPSWIQYVGGSPSRQELQALRPWSGMHLVENSVNTDFRFYHGTRDPGPMRPQYVREMEAHMRGLGLTPRVRWYDFGHDLLYLVHRHGRIYPEMAQVVRNRRPAEVRVVTGDYRANRQHWVTVERIEHYPDLARVVARASEGSIEVQTTNTLAISLELRDAPVGDGEAIRIVVDGDEVYAGDREALGHVVRMHQEARRWRLGRLPRAEGLEKVPGLSGPLTDPYYDGMIHVYGTLVADQRAELQRAAQRGARGWPLWLWNHQQRVVADVDVTEEMMRSSHLVLYGTPGSNAVLERIADRLPVRVDASGIVVGSRRLEGADLGTRFIYPNPDAPGRYVIVQAGVNVAAVSRGHNLPDFLPDWVVYDARATQRRARLVSGRAGLYAMGYFDRFWRVREDQSASTVAGRLNWPFLPMPQGEDVLRAGPRLGVLEGAPLAGQRVFDFEGGDDGPLDASPPAAIDAAVASFTAEPPADGQQAESASANSPGTQNEVETRSEAELRRLRARILGVPASHPIPHQVLAQVPPITLPVVEPPPAPPRPLRFEAPASDPAGAVARRIAALVPTFLNYRAIVPGGAWTVDERAVFRIRRQATCLRDLRALGVRAARVRNDPSIVTPVPTPVEVRGPIEGVVLRTARPNERIVVACEFAARLPTLARIVRALGVRGIEILSAYRPGPRQSFHTFGLALDVTAFDMDDGRELRVEPHFEETPGHRTCEAPPPTTLEARTLLEVACALARSHAFSTVLTPNYNDGHRDHFHIDSRPDDPRFYVR